jgi:hypothetical protein
VFAQSQLAQITPAHSPLTRPGHSTSLLPMASALFCAIDVPQFLSFQMLPDSFHRNGGVYPLASSPSSDSLLLLFPEITQTREARPSQTPPLPFFTAHGSRVIYSFRINTCKSVTKQTTLTTFRMNTYEKTWGEGGTSPSIQNFIPEPTSVLDCDAQDTLRYLSPLLRGGRS